tara:strand:+ start:5814 stop:6245 length:432 start_codon:yes stop_codon:yes gene_type:complete
MASVKRLGLGEVERVTSPGEFVSKRDAVHVACVLVQCDVTVSPGQHVAFNGSDWVWPIGMGLGDALVDPFLTGPVDPGCAFWVCVLPGKTSNLTHHFDLDVGNRDAVRLRDCDDDPTVLIDDDAPDDDAPDEYDDDECRGCNS